jgi:murein DD-endopeptidase MepM/ murein hydrolase activator NlpD
VIHPGVVGLSLLASAAGASESRIVNRRVEANQTLAKTLRRAGLEDAQVEEVVAALGRGGFDFRKSRVEDQVRLVLEGDVLQRLDYRQNALDEWEVARDGEALVASKRSVDVERKVALVELSITASVWEAALAAGEDPNIAMELADVFAWDIDFYQDVRQGDHAKVLIEKVMSKGRLVRYGDLLAASYEGEAVRHKEVYRYQFPTGETSYFQRDGNSARKSFLKSPLKYAHITSGFGSRFHPILHYVSAHQGVDYGTPVGTPVWAVADGTVTRAGFSDGNGNHVCVRHANGFESCYLHLSKFGAGVHVGARVAQKQVIAYSGNTGLSTGPHLHYALKRGGSFVNPLNQKFPRADPVPATYLADFHQKTAPYQTWLDAAPVVAAAPASSPVLSSPAAATP